MYGCLKLMEASRADLLAFIEAHGGVRHPHITANHVTLWFKHKPEGFVAPTGIIPMSVTGIAFNADIQAVRVSVHPDVPVQNAIPHITVSHCGKPVLSGTAEYTTVIGPYLCGTYEEVN